MREEEERARRSQDLNWEKAMCVKGGRNKSIYTFYSPKLQHTCYSRNFSTNKLVGTRVAA